MGPRLNFAPALLPAIPELPQIAPMYRRLFTATLLASALCISPLLAASPTGRWHGSWNSASTGHRGPLKAHIRQVDSNTYRALFAGRFAKVVPFVYPAKLKRVPGTTNRYRSSTRLPLMGEYRMDATVTPSRFHAHYTSKEDRGVFDMSR